MRQKGLNLINIPRIRFIAPDGTYTEIVRDGIDIGDAEQLECEPTSTTIDPVAEKFYEALEDGNWVSVNYNVFMVLLVPANKARIEHDLEIIEVPTTRELIDNDE